MDTDTLRRKYLDFFANKAHKIIASSSLVPVDDPTLLFTCAGMNQFKKEFLGQVSDFRRAATCQRCLRTDDLDKVGQTASHHTFFEMLGNFSFGSYFKEEAISWAWEFLTRELKLSPDMLWVSVYQDDDEAFNIWKTKIGIPAEKIVKLGAEDNFWPANAILDGPNGPCGPCSEIFFDTSTAALSVNGLGCKNAGCRPGCSCGRFVEIWNLVFTQFNRKDNALLEPLPNKNIDTGMGLERMASVMQGVKSNFEIDIFRPIIKEIISYAASSGPEALANPIADHIRAIVFAIYDGVMPSNEERGYVIRKLIRKAEYHGRKMHIKGPFLHKLVPVVARVFENIYPDLNSQSAYIAKIIQEEEKSFLSTINESASLLKREFSDPQAMEQSGKTAFKLHDTYGIPLEITMAWAKERGFEINEEEFDLCLKEQQERSKKSSKLSASVFAQQAVDLDVSPTQFIGYDTLALQGAKILKIIKDDKIVDSVKEGEPCQIILDKTPFYAESGGQSGDKGRVFREKGLFLVEDTRKLGKIFSHIGRVESGRFSTADIVQAQVDREIRSATARAHTATHILQSALRCVLGGHIRQTGSWVEADRLRFDFIHPQKVSPEELSRIEDLAADNILLAREVEIKETSLEQARGSGALAFFEDKYEDRVRIVKIGDFSQELCGGTHLENSANVGAFRIISEGSISKGVRRIEALTGRLAWDRIKEERRQIERASLALKTLPEQLYGLIEEKLNRLDDLEKEIKSLKIELFKRDTDALINTSETRGNTKIISYKYQNADIDTLRRIMDLIRSILPSYAACLASSEGAKAWLIAGLSEDLINKGLDASLIIKEISSLIGGSGGGRKNMSQAGGNNPAGIDNALGKFGEIVRKHLG